MTTLGETSLAKWQSETGKPYGVFGITYSSTNPKTLELLNRAKFVYFRDSVSLDVAKSKGCTCPVMEFGPDGAFGTDLKNDEKADAFLKAHGLEHGKFLCCIPRLRYTPYSAIRFRKSVIKTDINCFLSLR